MQTLEWIKSRYGLQLEGSSSPSEVIIEGCFSLGGSVHPADSRARVGDAPTRPEKSPGDSNRDIGLVGELTYGEPRSGHRNKVSTAGTYMQ